MVWAILLASAALEAVWATALGLSDGFRRPIPVIVFAVAAVLSMLGLGYAARRIPIGTAYAVWTGGGAVLTVAYAMLTGEEPITVLRLVFLVGIVGAVVGLKFVPGSRREDAPDAERALGGPRG